MNATDAYLRPKLQSGPDSVLLGLGLALMLVGLIAIASASIEYSDWHFNNPWYHTIRHSVYLALAGCLALIAYRVPIDIWQRASPWLLLAAFTLLILVLIPGIGRSVNGSRRWLAFGPLTAQPSEIAKFSLVLYIASFLVRHGDIVRTHWQGIAKPVGVLALVVLLLLLEPDFGTAVICISTVFGMLFLAGAPLLYVLALVGAALGVLVLMIVSTPYRLQRLTSYMDPWQDPFGSGFQLIQSLIAYGRGEWFGVGLGNSIQKLFYLPEAHTDFVFSIWAEETGLIGVLVVIALYALLIARILSIGFLAEKATEKFSAYLCYGIALIFAGQAFVNMGASSGLLPTKGLTLPFISYGGSSLVVSCLMFAVVLRIEYFLRATAPTEAELPRKVAGKGKLNRRSSR